MAKILIVEDNPDNLKLFRAILSLKGHAITALASGEGLFEALAQSTPDLVLMDIQLPGRDGYELLQEIRQSAWSRLCVVALTAHARGQDEQRVKEAGFDGYVTKPIDIAQFPSQLEQALHRRASAP